MHQKGRQLSWFPKVAFCTRNPQELPVLCCSRLDKFE